jgi:hypothetical protein
MNLRRLKQKSAGDRLDKRAMMKTLRDTNFPTPIDSNHYHNGLAARRRPCSILIGCSVVLGILETMKKP